MNSNQIIIELSTISNFIGCFASDQLPDTIIEGSYVINFDPSYKRGTHWVAIIIKHNIIENFDSLSLKFIPKSIKLFIVNSKKKFVHFNNRAIQKFSTLTCGIYVIVLIKLSSLYNISLVDFMTIFKDLDKNSCEELVCKLFKLL